jgi:hypothetical protein
LGFRVVGGKKLPNGDLGAFIVSVDKSRAKETLGELKEGDQVLKGKEGVVDSLFFRYLNGMAFY